MSKIRSYHHIEDIGIDREREPGRAILHDEEGTVLYSFSADMTDAQIRQAFRFASQTYAQGQMDGSNDRAYEIRAALGVPNPEVRSELQPSGLSPLHMKFLTEQ